MDRKLLELVKIFNHAFMSYVLNIDMDGSIRRINLSRNQQCVVDILFDIAKQEKLHAIQKNDNFDELDIYYDLERYLFSNDNHNLITLLAYTYEQQKKCSQVQCIDSYHYNLLKFATSTYPYLLASINKRTGINLNSCDIERFFNAEELNKITVSDGLISIRSMIGGFKESIITSMPANDLLGNALLSAFENCCYRMDITLSAYLSEVTYFYKSLFLYKDKRRNRIPFFIGIYGFVFRNFEVLDLEDLVVRKIDLYKDPLSSVIKYVADVDGGHFNTMGVVAEIGYNATMERNKNIQKTESIYNEKTVEVTSDIKSKIDNFSFAVLLSKGMLKNVELYFINSGFLLKNRSIFEMSNDCHNGKKIVIEKCDLTDIKFWYGKLNKCQSKNILKPLRDIQSAILRDIDDKYAIIDALISWEAMFTTKEVGKVSSSVIDSISNYLKKGDRNFNDRIKKLYDLRSDIVHGREPKLFKQESVYELKIEIVNIALNCLKKLLCDDELRDKKPSQRVRFVLGD
ncbi:hypothetical protein L4D08_17685 [Photobacterium chitinilyticum]|uniref:hypothetical protein n=1 Tax=Photobacterium chitinilyticum TaxID=2485123 RepID=UPI003D0B6E89